MWDRQDCTTQEGLQWEVTIHPKAREDAFKLNSTAFPLYVFIDTIVSLDNYSSSHRRSLEEKVWYFVLSPCDLN